MIFVNHMHCMGYKCCDVYVKSNAEFLQCVALSDVNKILLLHKCFLFV